MNQNLTDWQFLKADSIKDADQQLPAEGVSGWKKYMIGKDVFDHKEGFGWFSTTLENPPAGVKQIQLEFRSVDENATVFVNGIKLGKHTGWNIPFSFTINRADTLKTPIKLTLFIENYSNEGGIDQAIHANYLLPSTKQLTGWRMHGGIPDPERIRDWKTGSGKNENEGPCFFRSSFNFSVRANSNAVYRVTTTGLGHGSIWVNGHNLGRYPEKIPVNGLYIPSCWMRNGDNNLYIYDEDGKYPGQVSIEAETAASRDIYLLSGS
jgi:beta-galactosidase